MVSSQAMSYDPCWKASSMSEKVTRKRTSTGECGVCGEQYDMGPAALVGTYRWYPKGLQFYWKHANAAHAKGSTKPRDICGGWCRWVCSTCGQVKQYRSSGVTHGGPPVRALDRRYGLAYCDGSSYPKHKRAFGRMDGARGPLLFYHEDSPNPPQPTQDDPKIVEIEKGLVREKRVPRSTPNSKGRQPRSGEDVPVTRRRATKDGLLGIRE